MGLSILVFMGEEVAGVASPPQGQHGLLHLLDRKHCLEKIFHSKIETREGRVSPSAGVDRHSQETLDDWRLTTIRHRFEHVQLDPI